MDFKIHLVVLPLPLRTVTKSALDQSMPGLEPVLLAVYSEVEGRELVEVTSSYWRILSVWPWQNTHQKALLFWQALQRAGASLRVLGSPGWLYRGPSVHQVVHFSFNSDGGRMRLIMVEEEGAPFGMWMTLPLYQGCLWMIVPRPKFCPLPSVQFLKPRKCPRPQRLSSLQPRPHPRHRATLPLYQELLGNCLGQIYFTRKTNWAEHMILLWLFNEIQNFPDNADLRQIYQELFPRQG